MKLPNADEFKVKYEKSKRGRGDGGNFSDEIDMFDINEALGNMLKTASKKGRNDAFAK